MVAITKDPSLNPHITKDYRQQPRVVTEEIDGLIRVFKDGHVERPQIVACVTANSLTPELGVTCRDIVIDKSTNIWARFYVPNCNGKLPLLVYFHGGGFCVGSATWSCYHDFLARLTAKAGCVIMSVNYRLAPENPLPAAYDDGLKALIWLKQHAPNVTSEWWSRKCNFSSMFLAGDSAGANIAYNVSISLNSSPTLRTSGLRGIILIQPFFGGESRTHSENHMAQSPHSALSLVTSDTYWRLSLPSGSNRDHPWCNPSAKGTTKLEELSSMVCVSELDILKDRNLEFCNALVSGGTKVEYLMCKGVGHAFQVLSKSQISQTRTLEMISHIKSFINR